MNNKLSNNIERKFTEVYDATDYEILTEDGWEDVIDTKQTIPYARYKIVLANGLFLECADTHILIDENYNEVYAMDSIHKNIRTNKGISKVIEVLNFRDKVNMYDIGVNSEKHTYYTNGILSHNTVVTAIYLLWKAMFTPQINIGIAANVQKLSTEVLDKIKKIFLELPIWLQAGVTVWNKQSIEFDNGTRILTSATSSDSFRGYSIHILYCSHEDEMVTVRDKITGDIKDISLKDLNEELLA